MNTFNDTDMKNDADTPAAGVRPLPLHLLRCPRSGQELAWHGEELTPEATPGLSYRVDSSGIPLFAERFCSNDARAQQQHYDAVASAYMANLGYPHTQEYMEFLDEALRNEVGAGRLGATAEICCGRGEAFLLFKNRIDTGVGVDISGSMLRAACQEHPETHLTFCQGDATQLPLSSDSFDTVFMLGGIHHVNDRRALFNEVARILKPGGVFYFREPVSDFILWRALRAVIYRLSPMLDHETERPLLFQETVPPLTEAGLVIKRWRTIGFLGFCLLMNSDVLFFNRLFRFIPGIRSITRLFTRIDEFTINFPGMGRNGLIVIGVAQKPGSPAIKAES